MPRQIFLSYAREDREIVENLYNKLIQNGYKPWMDTIDIQPGENWQNCIKTAIENSAFFLACLSNNSVNKRGFIQKEIRDALNIREGMLDNDIYLIPVRLEECDVQEKLEAIQWVNLYRMGGFDKLIKAIEEGMKRRDIKDYAYEKNNGNKSSPLDKIISEGEFIKPVQDFKKDLRGKEMKGYLRKILASSPVCQDRFIEAEKLAYGIFEDSQKRYVPLPLYNEYGIKHCQAVEAFLDEILSYVTDPNKDFIPNAEEAMYLLSGAWIHDIGMMYGIFSEEQGRPLPIDPDHCAKLRNEHEKRTSRHLWNVWNIECRWSPDEKTYLGNICHFHRKENSINEFSCPEITGTITKEKVRIKVIAALLRIANACHVDRSILTGGLRSLYDSLSMQPEDICYWTRAKLISDVCFLHSEQKIVIKSLIPKPIDFNRGKFDFTDIMELVRKEMEEALKDVQTVILPYTNTAFREIAKEVNIFQSLDVEAPRRCLGIWPYFLRKPFSATEGAASLAQMILLEMQEIKNFGEPSCKRIKGMIKEVIRWRPYDVLIFKLQKEVDRILFSENPTSPNQKQLEVYLQDFLKNICKNCNKMTERVTKHIYPNDVLFVYGFSVNIVKFLEAIKQKYLGFIYLVDSHSYNVDLPFETHEDDQMLAFLSEIGFDNKYIKLNEVSLIFKDLERSKKMSKILLGTHSVLNMGDNYYLLCKKGCKVLCLSGKDGGAKIFGFAETNKFIDIEKNEDFNSVIDFGFSYNQLNGSIGIASKLQNNAIKMDVISKPLVDYLITDEATYT